MKLTEGSVDRNFGMIKNPETLVLFRDNLIVDSINKSFDDIEIYDFKLDNEIGVPGLKTAWKQELILFIDKNGSTKLLKNRWGNAGKVR